MATKKQIEKLTNLTLTELRKRYAEVVGETTRAPNKVFLAKKILEAQAKPKAGKTGSKAPKPRKPASPSKPRKPATTQTADTGFMVLPFRVARDQVNQMDEAWKRLGLKNRSDLFRRSLHAFFLEAGETRAAALFEA